MFEVRVIFTFNDSQLVKLPLEIGKAGGAYGCWWWGKPKWEGVGKNGGRGHHLCHCYKCKNCFTTNFADVRTVTVRDSRNLDILQFKPVIVY